jgi:hypothetical protein
MMTLQIVSKHKQLLDEIATFLLNERLIANAMISENVIHKEINNGVVETTEKFILKSISKSLLFSKINEKLRKRYGEKTPLIYSEPIILIDPIQTEEIIKRLVKV